MIEYIVIAGLVGLVVGGLAYWILLRSQLAALYVELGQSRERAAQLETLVAEMRRKLAEVEARLRQPGLGASQPGDEQVSSLPRQEPELGLSQARQQIMVFQAQLGAVRARLSQLEDEVVHARQRAVAAEAASRDKFTKWRAEQKKATGAQAQLEQARERIDQLERDLAQAHSRFNRQAEQVRASAIDMPEQDPAALRLRQLEAEVRDVQAQLVAANLTRDETQACADQMQKELAQARREREAALQDVTSYKERVDQLELELAATRQREAEVAADPTVRFQQLSAMAREARAQLALAVMRQRAGLAEAEALAEAAPEGVEVEAYQLPIDNYQLTMAEAAPEGVEVEAEEEGETRREGDQEMMTYCTKCKAKRSMIEPYQATLAGRPVWKSTCPECGATLILAIKE